MSDTGIPSRNGYPKPGVRVMANDGVSVARETEKYTLNTPDSNDTRETNSKANCQLHPLTLNIQDD